MKRKIFWGDSGEEAKRTRTTESSGEKVLRLHEPDTIYAVGTQIHFTGEINSDSIEKLIKVFTEVIRENIPASAAVRSIDARGNVEFDEQEKLKIEYIVDSPGGSVTDVLKFVDFLDLVRRKHPYIEFTSIITGLVASAGTVMSVVADNRYMTKNAFSMIHELSSGTGGKYTQLMSYANFIQMMHDKLVKIYAEKTPLSEKQIEALLQKETWFDAEQYKKLGFVDDIRPDEPVVDVS